MRRLLELSSSSVCTRATLMGCWGKRQHHSAALCYAMRGEGEEEKTSAAPIYLPFIGALRCCALSHLLTFSVFHIEAVLAVSARQKTALQVLFCYCTCSLPNFLPLFLSLIYSLLLPYYNDFYICSIVLCGEVLSGNFSGDFLSLAVFYYQWRVSHVVRTPN